MLLAMDAVEAARSMSVNGRTLYMLQLAYRKDHPYVMIIHIIVLILR
jgi:hypothetical protein